MLNALAEEMRPAMNAAGVGERVGLIKDLVGAGEYVIALEDLCSNVNDFDCLVCEEWLQQVQEVGLQLGVAAPYWEILQPEARTARAVAANVAQAFGINILESVIAVRQMEEKDFRFWCVTFGPQNIFSQRGGDLTVEVSAEDFAVRRVLRGQ